eukprot:548427_1
MAYNIIKIVVLGAQGVGKSAITIRLVANEFLAFYDPTIEDCYTCEIQVDGTHFQLDVLDTAGDPHFEAPRDCFIRPTTNFILVYDIISLESFEDVKTLCTKVIKRGEDERLNVMLVGNKCDSVSTIPVMLQHIPIRVKDLINGFMRRIQNTFSMHIPIEINRICYVFHCRSPVSYEMGYELAKSWNIPFIETSAKTGENILEAFQMLVREIHKPIPSSQGTSNRYCCNIL